MQQNVWGSKRTEKGKQPKKAAFFKEAPQAPRSTAKSRFALGECRFYRFAKVRALLNFRLFCEGLSEYRARSARAPFLPANLRLDEAQAWRIRKNPRLFRLLPARTPKGMLPGFAGNKTARRL